MLNHSSNIIVVDGNSLQFELLCGFGCNLTLSLLMFLLIDWVFPKQEGTRLMNFVRRSNIN